MNWIWRCRFDSSTTSSSRMVSSTPALPSASAIGPPSPPAPTTVARVVMPGGLAAHACSGRRRRSRRRTRHRDTAGVSSVEALACVVGELAVVAGGLGVVRSPRRRRSASGAGRVVASSSISPLGFRPRRRSSPQLGAARPHTLQCRRCRSGRRSCRRGRADADPSRRSRVPPRIGEQIARQVEGQVDIADPQEGAASRSRCSRRALSVSPRSQLPFFEPASATTQPCLAGARTRAAATPRRRRSRCRCSTSGRS